MPPPCDLSTILTRRTLCIIAAFLCAGLTLNAQSIGAWNFNGNFNGIPGTYNTVSNADFSVGVPGRAYNAGSEYYGQDGWPAGALDPSLYLAFTLTPNAGYALNILSIDLRLRHSNTGSLGGSGPTRFTLRSSLDGYTSDVATGGITGAYANFVINPGAAFNSLPTAVTFRVYGHNSVLYTGGNNRFVFDNINVDAIGVILPARLISFSARPEAGRVIVQYHLTELSAGTRLMVERSVDNIIYKVVNDETIQRYEISKAHSVTDEPPGSASTYYYRVKISSSALSSFYSPVSTIHLTNKTTSITVMANRSHLKIAKVFPGVSSLLVYSNSGRLIVSKRFEANANPSTVEIDLPGLSPGIYYLSLNGNITSTTAGFTIW